MNSKLIKTKTGYLSIVPKPDQSELDAFYKDSYFKAGVTSTYHASYTDDEIKYKENRASATVRFIASNSNKHDLKLLDIGAGEGFLLRAANDFGWKVKGVDFQLEPCLAFNEAMAECFEVANPMEFLDNSPSHDGKYDVVCLQNVIEHVREPEALIRLAKKHLALDGCLFIQVPNDFSDLQKFCINQKFVSEEYWVAPPQHLSYFSKESLENFLKAEGLKCHDFFSDFPIELLLCGSKDNYISDSSLGPIAHKSRVQLDNEFFNKGVDLYINFYRSMCQLGLGRNIIALAKRENVSGNSDQ